MVKRFLGILSIALLASSSGGCATAPPEPSEPAPIEEVPAPDPRESRNRIIRALAEHLRTFPDIVLAENVEVVWAPLQAQTPGWLGQTYRNDWTGDWTLVLDEWQSPVEAWRTLIHEWAHALSGRPGHGDAWALCYGRVYRASLRYEEPAKEPEQDPNQHQRGRNDPAGSRTAPRGAPWEDAPG